MRFLIFALAFLLSACVTNPAATGKNEIENRVGVLFKVTKDPKFVIKVVPSSGSFISDKLVVGMLKAGTATPSSEQISQMLSGQDAIKLAITSKSDAIAAATFERALSNLKEKPVAQHEIAFIGGKEFEEELVNKAAEAGIKLLYVPYP